MSEKPKKEDPRKYCIFAAGEIIKASNDLRLAELSYLAGDLDKAYERLTRALSRLHTYNLRRQSYNLGQEDIVKSFGEKVEKIRDMLVKGKTEDIVPYTFEYLSNELLEYGTNFTQLCQEKVGKFFFKITPKVITKKVGKRKKTKEESEQK